MVLFQIGYNKQEQKIKSDTNEFTLIDKSKLKSEDVDNLQRHLAML